MRNSEEQIRFAEGKLKVLRFVIPICAVLCAIAFIRDMALGHTLAALIGLSTGLLSIAIMLQNYLDSSETLGRWQQEKETTKGT